MPFPRDANPRLPTELDRLQVAFAVFIARDIVNADGIVDMDEVELLVSAFPNPWLITCGFLDADERLNVACERAYERALQVLPAALDPQRKLELITLFHRTTLADGEVHPEELRILHKAADALAIHPDEVDAQLRRLER